MEEFIFNYLKGYKKDIGCISNQTIKTLVSLSKKYQLIGFISSAYKFSNKNKSKELSLIKRASFAKNLMMMYDLDVICKKFNQRNIDYCVLKGPALVKAKIYKPGVRFFRDLDILVSKNHLGQAFHALNELGFRYVNKLAENNYKILGKMHHLPIMINDSGTYLELHHRLTLNELYEDCPVTEKVLGDKFFHDGMYIPSPKALIGHALYHGLIHHDETIGPIALFDIKAIAEKNNLNLSNRNEYVLALNLEKKMEEVNYLFSRIQKQKEPTGLEEILIQIKDNISLSELTDNRVSIFDGKRIKKKLMNNFFYRRIEFTEFKYQTKRSKFKFLLFFILELIRSIRNIRLF